MSRLARGLLLLIMLAGGKGVSAAGELWLPAAVDHVDVHLNVLLYTDASGQRYVREIDVHELQLPVSAGPRYRHAAEWYYRVDDLPEHEIHVDDVGRRTHFVRRVRPHVEPPPAETLLLDVTVNDRRIDEPLLMHYRHGEIVMSESALLAIGINQDKARLLLKEDDALPLHAVAGENFALDHAQLALVMTVPPELFRPVRIDVASPLPAPATPAPGVAALLGYDVTVGRDASDNQWEAGLFELTVGGATTTCGSHFLRPQDETELRRLDSRCIFDWPSRLLSLQVGDAISNPGRYGQAVRYGGVRVGTDFGLAPSYITQPSLALLGSTRVPSTLEVWVDQMLALRREIHPGVFQLQDIPVHTGAGEVRAVVTNALGMREVVARSFYSDPALLAQGLFDWSLELGRVREGYALPTDHYAERFGVVNARYGVTSWLTAEPRFEATEHFRTAGIGTALRVGRVGVVEAFRSVSRTDAGLAGNADEFAFSRRGRYLSMNLRHARADQHYVQLGYDEPGATPAERSQASIGVNLGARASLNVGGIERRLHDDTQQRFHTAALNVRVGPAAQLLLSAFEPVEPAGEPMYSVHLTIPLGARDNLSASAYRQGRELGYQLSAQRSLPSGPGMGYRVATGETDGTAAHLADIAMQAEIARLQLHARQRGGETGGYAQLNGSVVASGNGLHLTRWREGSAAVVSLPAGRVRVYHDERLAAVTDGGGQAIIPGLRPYQPNRLRIEIDDLPLDAQIRESDLLLTPGRRQAVAAQFTVERKRHLQARLWQGADGKAVPTGASVTVVGEELPHPVGFDGLVYLPVGEQSLLNVDVHWPGGACRAQIFVPESPRAIVDAGPVHCKE